jgi:hypothetical protein
MRKTATTLLVLLGLFAATSAFAVDVKKAGLPTPRPVRLNATAILNTPLGCDDGVEYNAYFQNTDDRIGNVFSFGSGATLSRLSFEHFGFGFPGPYNYNIELWDPTSCTFVAAKNGLIAQDAANDFVFEDVDLCSDNIHVAGDMIVTIDPNSCAAPNDCYPDVLFDDQLEVFCPVIINDASTSPACFDVSPISGPFILRVDINNCPVPAKKTSWGELKTLYR